MQKYNSHIIIEIILLVAMATGFSTIGSGGQIKINETNATDGAHLFYSAQKILPVNEDKKVLSKISSLVAGMPLTIN